MAFVAWQNSNDASRIIRAVCGFVTRHSSGSSPSLPIVFLPLSSQYAPRIGVIAASIGLS